VDDPRGERADDCMTPAYISALNAPVRREVLRVMHRDPSQLTATQISRKMRTVSSQLVSHHLDVLLKKELVRFVDSKPLRGGLEKFFVSEVREHAQVRRILADTEGDDISLRR
jgi:DNA-binding transcriptional ArsR family regulator